MKNLFGFVMIAVMASGTVLAEEVVDEKASEVVPTTTIGLSAALPSALGALLLTPFAAMPAGTIGFLIATSSVAETTGLPPSDVYHLALFGALMSASITAIYFVGTLALILPLTSLYSLYGLGFVMQLGVIAITHVVHVAAQSALWGWYMPKQLTARLVQHNKRQGQSGRIEQTEPEPSTKPPDFDNDDPFAQQAPSDAIHY